MSQQLPSSSGQKEQTHLDNEKLRSKIMALERLADQSERAQTRLEQRCEKLAQDNADAEAEIKRLHTASRKQPGRSARPSLEGQSHPQPQTFDSSLDVGSTEEDRAAYTGQLERQLAVQRKHGEDLKQQLDSLRLEKEQLDGKKKRLESQYENVAEQLASVTTGEANPAHKDVDSPANDRQQRIAASNLLALNALKTANPSSHIRDRWTGHDFLTWDGIKSRDGIIVGMALPDANLQSLPEEIGLLVGLEMLIVSYNRLRTLPKSIGNLHRLGTLRTLGLAQLITGSLDEPTGYVILLQTEGSFYDLGELRQLAHLWLEDNQLQRLPPSLHQLHCLQRLRLAGNSLQQEDSIPDAVKALPCFSGSMERAPCTERPRAAVSGCEEASGSGRSRPTSGKPLKSALSRSTSPETSALLQSMASSIMDQAASANVAAAPRPPRDDPANGGIGRAPKARQKSKVTFGAEQVAEDCPDGLARTDPFARSTRQSSVRHLGPAGMNRAISAPLADSMGHADGPLHQPTQAQGSARGPEPSFSKFRPGVAGDDGWTAGVGRTSETEEWVQASVRRVSSGEDLSLTLMHGQLGSVLQASASTDLRMALMFQAFTRQAAGQAPSGRKTPGESERSSFDTLGTSGAGPDVTSSPQLQQPRSYPGSAQVTQPITTGGAKPRGAGGPMRADLQVLAGGL
ncbi:hypothetical protein WJX84_009022 [Apatococcus fuscideae]|uniref:Uncharacterized protein n=1 Tax=Apatococcus fuscideae TaxID=2026836 RepID=A0AAW1SVH3_9CHLO